MIAQKRLKLSLKFNQNKVDQAINEKSSDSNLNKLTKSELCGLKNLQNTCFINCILHVLAFTPAFLREIHTYAKIIEKQGLNSELSVEEELLFQLHQIFRGLRKKVTNEELTDSMKRFLVSLRKLNPSYEGFLQHDAHEFFSRLLHHMDNAITTMFQNGSRKACKSYKTGRKRKKKPMNKNINILEPDPTDKNRILSVFKGNLWSVNRCLECENEKETCQDFLDVHVLLSEVTEAESDASPENVDNNDNSGSEDEQNAIDDPISLSLNHSDGMLNGDNKFWCLHCHQHTEAIRSKHFENLPPVLTFHVERFSNRSSNSKIMKSFTVPQHIHYKELRKHSLLNTYEYKLFAFVIHTGISISSGHFTCYVKNHHRFKFECNDLLDCCHDDEHNVGQWLFYDDEKVIAVSNEIIDALLSENSTETVYLLFYFRDKN